MLCKFQEGEAELNLTAYEFSIVYQALQMLSGSTAQSVAAVLQKPPITVANLQRGAEHMRAAVAGLMPLVEAIAREDLERALREEDPHMTLVPVPESWMHLGTPSDARPKK